MPSSPPRILPTFPLSAAVKASTLVGAGSTGVLFTAATAGAAGNELEIATADDASTHLTTAAESGNAITITRAAKARMELEGDFGNGMEIRILLFGSTEWVGDGAVVGRNSAGLWSIEATSAEFTFQETDTEYQFPDQIPGPWVAIGNAVQGTLTVTALSSSASQVADAAQALTLVDATLDGDGSGVFPALSAPDPLTGGYSVAASPPAIQAAGGTVTPSSPPVIQS